MKQHQQFSLCSDPINLLLKKDNGKDESHFHLFKEFKRQGIKVSWPTFYRWFNNKTFNTDYKTFNMIVNTFHIPILFYLRPDLAHLLTPSNIITPDKWVYSYIDVSQYVIDFYTAHHHSLEATHKGLNLSVPTINKYLCCHDNTHEPFISIKKVINWFNNDDIDEYKYIHDFNIIYTGHPDIDLSLIDRQEAHLANDEYINSLGINKQIKEKYTWARHIINAGYPVSPESYNGDSYFFAQRIKDHIDHLINKEPTITNHKLKDKLIEYLTPPPNQKQ